jgi:trehalose 6-phosphate phosphatase
VLAGLAARLGRVAVVSGRPVAFLRAALPVAGLTLVGQYGLERLEGGGEPVRDPRAQRWAAALEAAAQEAETALPGLRVERKGGLAVGLHWREHPGLEAAALRLGRRLAGALGLDVQPARLALELRPPLPVDKGVAAAAVAEGAGAVLVAGDDHGDLAAFRAVADLARRGEIGHALLVAVGSPEAPEELLSLADRVVDGPAGLLALLGELVAACPGPAVRR